MGYFANAGQIVIQFVFVALVTLTVVAILDLFLPRSKG